MKRLTFFGPGYSDPKRLGALISLRSVFILAGNSKDIRKRKSIRNSKYTNNNSTNNCNSSNTLNNRDSRNHKTATIQSSRSVIRAHRAKARRLMRV